MENMYIFKVIIFFNLIKMEFILSIICDFHKVFDTTNIVSNICGKTRHVHLWLNIFSQWRRSP